ncbi:MAG: BlaI/MecI/CopY family transcriptional regulator [Lachnospiraceae bacterium]|nr:BlaI/MecI/CopY family transcriptional regulator [Lachnospiraceae bacterium]
MKPITKLPDLELDVMQAVWMCEEPILRKDIENALKLTHRVAPTTVLTVLTRLRDKGFVSLEKIGNKLRIHVLISREAYQSEQGKYFLNRICRGNIFALGNALCDASLSKDELQELAEFIQKKSHDK